MNVGWSYHEVEWPILRELLQRSLAYLDIPQNKCPDLTTEYQTFLDHNEFELAWDTLFGIAQLHKPQNEEFYFCMKTCALCMNFPGKAHLLHEFQHSTVST